MMDVTFMINKKIRYRQSCFICQCPNESWHGWNETRKVHSGGEVTSAGIQFGLEMQCPYAELLLKGHKTIETRSYPLPSPLLTKANDVQVRIEILESESGQDGVSSIPDQVNVLTIEQSENDLSTRPFLVKKGWCTFIQSFRYTSREQFEADEIKHLVTSNSGYGWDDKRIIFGWVVGTCGKNSLDDDVSKMKYNAIRRMRSLFEIQEN